VIPVYDDDFHSDSFITAPRPHYAAMLIDHFIRIEVGEPTISMDNTIYAFTTPPITLQG
jgi:hypothetical protein